MAYARGKDRMVINIQDDILKIYHLRLLDALLADKTTKRNILWATDAYHIQGTRYSRDEEITPDLITGINSDIIKTRARKAMEQQSERTRQHAEVFTPLWVCEKMNDHADEVWFGEKDVFRKDGQPTEKVIFQKKKTWKQYVDSRRLEITCGEAPYLVSRYDVETGEMIPVPDRIGILDRKLRVVNENAEATDEWLNWAIRAFQATYGYEFQGDNLLIARVNLLMTFEEYMVERWRRKPLPVQYAKLCNIISWNLWQMDGLTGRIPYMAAKVEFPQMDFMDMLGPEMVQDTDDGFGQLNFLEPLNADTQAKTEKEQLPCRIYDWRGGRSLEYLSLQKRNDKKGR